MSFDAEAVETLTFDSYSTIVDVASAAEALAPHVDAPERAADHWRAHSLMYTMVANATDEYEQFYDLNRHAATAALDRFGASVDQRTLEEIASVYHDLHVFNDVRAGMERLAAEYDLYVVSNGDPAMLESMVEAAEIAPLIADTISADEIETFKPAAAIYEHAADRTGTGLESIAHVSAAWFDIHGASAAGMQTCWVDRTDSPFISYGPRPDLTVEDFGALAASLDC